MSRVGQASLAALTAAARGATVSLRGEVVGEGVSWEMARLFSMSKGDRHAPSPSDLRAIVVALGSAEPRAPTTGLGPDPILSAAARLDLMLMVDGKDRTAALLAGPDKGRR